MKLDENFTYHAYDIDVRLADLNDSEFILSLRTNIKLSRFLHSTSSDIELQKKWMIAYKEREKEGKDYYFIYSHEGIPFGVNRIYDIKENCATGGSWICKPGTNVELSMSTLLIMRDIMFNVLGLEADNFDVRKGNRKVQKIHLMMGAVQIGETELDYLYTLSKQTYLKKRDDFINLLNIKM